MNDTCELWTAFHPGGGVTHEPPHIFLQFRHSNLLVGLKGNGSMQDSDTAEVVLSDTDALGLGLRADDFEDGVAVCRDDSTDGVLGWRCHPVAIRGLAQDGSTTQIHSRRTAATWLGQA
jgi:hypothetical protein